MDNQHRKIMGYRELTQEEINNMNIAKGFEQSVMEFIDKLSGGEMPGPTPDGRWLAIAKTDIQKGFMALGRAIARPDGY